MTSATSVDAVSILGTAVVLIELLATARYIRAVLRGETRPSRASWLIWTTLSWLTLAGSIEAGATATSAKLAASALGVTAIAVAALVRGTGGLKRSDVACCALAGCGLGFWMTSDDPVSGLLIFLAADMAGALPTLRDTWRDPRREAPDPWLLGLVSSVLTLPLVDDAAWTTSWEGFAHWGFPIYLTVLDLTVLTLAFRGRLGRGSWAARPAWIRSGPVSAAGLAPPARASTRASQVGPASLVARYPAGAARKASSAAEPGCRVELVDMASSHAGPGWMRQG